ncbi:hypothetical protein ACET3Z_017630 [Daucus carota]
MNIQSKDLDKPEAARKICVDDVPEDEKEKSDKAMAAEELEDFHNTGEPVIVKDVDVMEIDKNEFTDERKVGVPVQSGTKECGLFVMRYMKEIVLDKELEFADKEAIQASSRSPRGPSFSD